MTLTAIALILVAALIHATWNLLVKRAGGGIAFLWLFALVTTITYAPVAATVTLIQKPRLGWVEFLFMGGTAGFHLVYFVLLQRGYRAGDLSLVYPLARGTGPLLATASAIAVMGERPGPLALAGALLIAVGVFVLAGGLKPLRVGESREAVGYGLITGMSIAAYTLWDKTAVSSVMISPILLEYSSNLGRVALLAPRVLRRRREVRQQWHDHWKEAVGVGLLCPLSYICVLTAMVFTPVSYVAPAREISILVGAFMGAHFLAEGERGRRVLAAGTMVAGVIALAAG